MAVTDTARTDTTAPGTPATGTVSLVKAPRTVHVLRYGLAAGEDIGTAAPLLFGVLYSLAAPVMRHYQSDLYHDALYLAEHVNGTSFTFHYSVDESGTCIGTDRLALYRRDKYRITVRIDRRGRTVATVYTVAA